MEYNYINQTGFMEISNGNDDGLYIMINVVRKKTNNLYSAYGNSVYDVYHQDAYYNWRLPNWWTVTT